MSTTRWLSVVATVAVFATAGCPDTDGNTGGDARGDIGGGAASSVTRAQFAEQGNQQMRELERPSEDAAALERLFGDMDTVLDGLMKEPDPFIVGPNPFAGDDPEFIRLGMDACAG